MRDDMVPCKHATLYEIERGLHFTNEEEGICNPCLGVLEHFDRMRAEAAAEAAVEERLEQNRQEAARNIAWARHPSNQGEKD